jgi:hypothetical protein
MAGIEKSQLRIEYDLDLLKQEFLNLLESLQETLCLEKNRTTLGKDLLRNVDLCGDDIRLHLESTFSLIVVGDFKRGKSTLINALLGEDIVTTDVTPETVTINRLEYSPQLEVLAHLADGGLYRFEPNKLKREELIDVLAGLPVPVTHLTVRAPCDMLKGLVLIDTPGLGDIFRRFDQQVMDYLQECDTLIHVVSALAPLSASEQNFLRVAVLPQEFRKIAFVVNMMDAISTDDEATRLLGSIHAKLDRLFPNAAVFPLSALDEISRQQQKPRPNPQRSTTLEQQFATFRCHLEDSIFLNRELLMLDRAFNRLETVLDNVQHKVDLLRDTMQADHSAQAKAIDDCANHDSELHRKFEQDKQALKRRVSELADQASDWMDGFIARIDTEVIATLDDFSYEEIRMHLHFFLVESLRRAITEILESQQSEFVELSASLRIRAGARLADLSGANRNSLEVAQTTFGDRPWTGIDTVHFVTQFMDLGVLLEMLVGHIREKQQDELATKVIANLHESLPQLREKMHSQIGVVYSRISERMIEEAQSTYQQDMESVLAALRQAKELHASGTEVVEGANQVFDELLNEIAEIRTHLICLRDKLGLTSLLSAKVNA